MQEQRTVTMHVSVGEAIDRLTILRIKLKNSAFADPAAYDAQVRYWREQIDVLDGERRTADLERTLVRINGMLWRLEDRIRRLERDRDFGPRYVCVSRLIRRLNDRRAKAKARIDEVCKSGLADRKRYVSL